MGKGYRTSTPSPSTFLGPPAQKLLEFCPFGFLWVYNYIVMIDQVIGHWLSQPLAPLTFLKVRGGQTEGYRPLLTWLILLGLPKGPLISRHLYRSTLRKCWGFESREPGIMSGDQIHVLMTKYIFLINHTVAVRSHRSVELIHTG